jgi:tripartite-type tricarboxylate transporter receptor subunit TctC
MENAGGTIVGSSPEQFGAYHQKEMVKWRKVIKAAGLAPG